MPRLNPYKMDLDDKDGHWNGIELYCTTVSLDNFSSSAIWIITL